ncbi:putative oxidoreductase GLYR1 [Varanus komodoensis]|nr:putative oxidoreductase GLYR1 [Varanus komodoensis]
MPFSAKLLSETRGTEQICNISQTLALCPRFKYNPLATVFESLPLRVSLSKPSTLRRTILCCLPVPLYACSHVTWRCTETSVPEEGFLGLGLMGSGIVSNLLKMGHTVTVWNRTAEKCDLFIQEGARLGRTPAEVVSTCDITFACVSDPKAAKDVRITSFLMHAPLLWQAVHN